MPNEYYDYIIIGAGAAGLSSAQYGARSGMKTLVLDVSIPGGQALSINNLENYPGVFPAVNGSELVQTMEKQARMFGAEIRQAQVSAIDKVKDKFTITTDSGLLECAALLIATGAEHRMLGVPGETEFTGRGVSYCATCDGPFFAGKKILVVGGGDSACVEAEYLAELTDDVVMVHRRSELRAQKAIADRVLINKNITVRFNSAVEEIRGDGKVQSVILSDTITNERTELPCDAVFIFAGMKPRTDIVSILPVDRGGYITTDENMATAVPGIFCAGDVRAKPFRQLVTAVSDGAVAAHAAENYIRTLRGISYDKKSGEQS